MALRSTINCSLLLAAGVLLLCVTTSSIAQKHKEVAVPKEVAQQLLSDYEDGELRAETVDLNNDGRPELIVQGGCAAVGNCSTWVFRKTKNGYQQLLNDEAQVVRTNSASVRGYRDIVFQVHGSAYESKISTYRFDGKHYRLKGCIYRNYSYIDKKGRFQIRKRPQITKC